MALVDVATEGAEAQLAGSKPALAAALNPNEGCSIFSLELVVLAQLEIELAGQASGALGIAQALPNEKLAEQANGGRAVRDHERLTGAEATSRSGGAAHRRRRTRHF